METTQERVQFELVIDKIDSINEARSLMEGVRDAIINEAMIEYNLTMEDLITKMREYHQS